MFANSSQMKYWTLSGTTELKRLRTEANEKYVSSCEDNKSECLTPEEETKIRRHHEYVLNDFCTNFQPPMPKYVVGTSMTFFKRFYLHNSVMDYHPKYILLICCYLACKLEEFNVSLTVFVSNCRGDREKLADIILSLELLLMQQLHYHLTVHNPYRPMEGLIIDIKTRCKDIADAEQLRPLADEFLDKALFTDVCLIFAPSQIALAALLYSANKSSLLLDSFVANKLLASGGREKLLKTQEHIKRIRFMVKNQDPLERSEVKLIEKRLQLCRNKENDPESEEYATKQQELEDEEDDRQVKKRRKIAEEERKKEAELLGI